MDFPALDCFSSSWARGHRRGDGQLWAGPFHSLLAPFLTERKGKDKKGKREREERSGPMGAALPLPFFLGLLRRPRELCDKSAGQLLEDKAFYPFEPGVSKLFSLFNVRPFHPIACHCTQQTAFPLLRGGLTQNEVRQLSAYDFFLVSTRDPLFCSSASTGRRHCGRTAVYRSWEEKKARCRSIVLQRCCSHYPTELAAGAPNKLSPSYTIVPPSCPAGFG